MACLLLILLAPTFLSSCVSRFPTGPETPSGTYRVSTDIRFNLSARDYLLHIPPDTNRSAPLPLVVVLHGAFSTARQTEVETGFSALADQKRFLVVYPEGIGLFGLLQHWNAGHCCGKAERDNIDDIAYIDAVIDKTSSLLAVDSNRIYMAGMSNGGMLAYRYAVERGKKLAAIAVVSAPINSHDSAGAPPRALPAPAKPLPVIAFHGTADGQIPINGGISPLKGGRRTFSSYEEAKKYWHRAANCTATAIPDKSRQGAVIRESTTCSNDIELAFYTLKDWEHLWPGPYFTSRLNRDYPLYNFDATITTWEFFRKFTRTSNPRIGR